MSNPYVTVPGLRRETAEERARRVARAQQERLDAESVRRQQADRFRGPDRTRLARVALPPGGA